MTLDQMWTRLEEHQSYANQRGYGPAWARMCAERTEKAAWAMAEEAWAVADAAAAREAAWAEEAAPSAAAVAATAAARAAVAEAWAAQAAVKWIEQAEDPK